MKLLLKLTIVLLVYLNVNAQEHISLVAPSSVLEDKPYGVFLSTSSYFDYDTFVVINFRNQFHKQKIVADSDTQQNRPIKFNNEGKPLKDIHGKTGFPLNIFASQQGKCVRREIVVVRRKQKNHIFIQLDKPFYNPGDTVRYRVIAFDHDTKPLEFNSLKVDVIDSENNTVSDSDNFSDISKSFGKHGVHENSFVLGEYLNEGLWHISVMISNNDNLKTTKSFSIKSLSLPRIEVKVETNDKVYYTDEKFSVTLSATHAIGKSIGGKALLTVSQVGSSNVLYENHYSFTSKSKFDINFVNDLGINFLPHGELHLRIQVKMDHFKRTFHGTKDLTVLSKRSHKFNIIKSNPFVPGVTYEFSVVVYDYNDQIISSSYDPVKIKYKQIANGKVPGGTASRDGRIKNSVATFQIDTINNELDNNELEIEISYLDTKIVEKVTSKGKVLSEALRVFVKTNEILKGNELVPISVENPEGVYSIVVLVISRLGIVFSKDHYCGGDIKCQTSIQTEEDMLPESKVVVYSFQEYNKEVLFGSTILKFDKLSSNHLSINLGPETSAQPKDKISISLTTKKDSLVSILAIDKKLTFVDKGHDITREDVIKALTNTEKLVHHKSKGEDITFDEKNSNFIIRLQLDQWRDCTKAELTTVEEMKTSKLKGHDSDEGIMTEGKSKDPIDLGNDNDDIKLNEARIFFPDTWIWETGKASSENYTINEIVPDSITSWVFTAFSLHKEHGIAIAEPKQLSVFKEFFIEVDVAYSVTFGEIPKINIIVFNFARNSQTLNVELTIFTTPYNSSIKQFAIVEVNPNNIHRCEANSMNISFNVTHNSGEPKSISITPLVNKEMLIRVEARTTIDSKLVKDFIQKKVKVINKGVTFYSVGNMEFQMESIQNSSQYAAFNQTEQINVRAIQTSSVISSSIMGTSINVDYNDFQKNTFENLLTIFGSKLYVYKHLVKFNQSNHKTAANDLKTIYTSMNQHKGKINDTDMEAFIPFESGAPSTYLTAFTAYLFKEAIELNLFEVDKNVVYKLMSFCNSTQELGNFSDYSETSSNKLANESSQSYSYRLTALNVLALHKSSNFSITYENGSNFIRKGVEIDNYAAAVIAYAVAIIENSVNNSLLMQLEKKQNSNGEEVYWDHNNTKSDKSIQVAISAHVALAYMHLNLTEKAKPIIKFLLKNREPSGLFGTNPISNIMGIKALVAFAEKSFVPGTTKMNLTFFSDVENTPQTYLLTYENAKRPHIIDMPKKTQNVTVNAVGIGYAFVTAFYEYNLNVTEISNTFDLTAISSYESNWVVVKACVKPINLVYKEKGKNIIMQFSFVSGYIYDAEKSNSMEQLKGYLVNVKAQRGGTILDLVFTHLPENSTCINIYTEKIHTVTNAEKGAVVVYDDYQKDSTIRPAYYDVK